MEFNFLKSLVITDKSRVRLPKETNPKLGLTLRVFKTGECYPSHDLVTKFNLEYKNRNSKEGKGIDIVDSKQWTPLAEYPRMILFGFPGKTEPKIDLFGTCRYNEDSTPKSSVMTQGTKNERLVQLCTEMGWITGEQSYVDLEIVTEYPIKVENNVAFLPKTVDRGARKGEATYERRENIEIFPIQPTDMKQEMKQETKETELATTELETTN